MHILEFSINNQIIVWTNPCRVPVEGTEGFLFARFDTDDEWYTMNRTAIFQNGLNRPVEVPVTEELTPVPPEVIKRGQLFVGLVGRDSAGEIKLTTQKMWKGVPLSAATESFGKVPDNIVPEAWEKALASIGNLSDLNTEAKNNLVAAINEVFSTGAGSGGSEGTDGREVEMSVVNGYIVWRYVGETAWKNLIALSDLKGDSGRGVKSIAGNADGSWTITYTDNTIENVSSAAYAALKATVDKAVLTDAMSLTAAQQAQVRTNIAAAAAADLTNYYRKSETYSQSEINAKISAIPKFSIAPVTTLPTNGISATTVYLVKINSAENLYMEYIFVSTNSAATGPFTDSQGRWEPLGAQTVDLTGYATEAWVNLTFQPIGSYVTEEKFEALSKSVSELSTQKASLPLAEDGTINAGISGQYATSDGAGGFNWTDGPTTLPNPNALTFTGAVAGSYDGSSKMSARIPQVVSWANKELFDKADLIDPGNINSFVTVDGVEYYRYHAGETRGFTWNNPHPLPGSVTITARGVSQYGGSGDERLKTIYDDGTYGPDLYIVVSGESKTATVTTDESKTLAKITGNYDLENWVLLDMSVMSIVANYNVGVPLADSNVPGGIKADPATETDTVPAKIGADGKLYVPDMSGGGGGIVSGDYIPVPSTAEVGQTIVVKAVDENGKPTEWEAADVGGWDLIADITLTEDGGGAGELAVTRSDKGEDFEYRQCMVCLSGTVVDEWPSGAYQYIYLHENNDVTGSRAEIMLSRISAGAGGTEYKTTVELSVFGNLVRAIACGGSSDTSSLIIRSESSIDKFRSIRLTCYGNKQWVAAPFAAGGRVVIYGRK